MSAPTDSVEVNALTLLAAPALGDFVHVNDISDTNNSFKITLQSIIELYGTLTDTLTNKTFALGSNTFTGTAAQFDTAVTDDNFAFVSDNLSVFANTTSAQLAGILTDETGTGAAVFATSPTLTTPALGTPSALVLTNATGLPVTGLANGTDGELITWSAAGVATTVAVGTSGHVLTSNGAGAAPTFQANPAGFADPMTTRGDIIYRDATNTTTRLGAGTVNQVLTSDGTDISWAAAGAADNLGNHIATQDLDMSDNDIIDTRSLVLNGTTPLAHLAGQLFYDTDNESLSFHNTEADITLQVGQEDWVYVNNSSGATISNGQAVYINGAQGGANLLPTIALAQADAISTSDRFLGLATHDIENNTDGFVAVFGQVRDFDTSAFSNGDEVWLSSSTAGTLTNTRPAQPNFAIPVGQVTRSHATLGSVLLHEGSIMEGAFTTNAVPFAGSDGFLKEDSANFTYTDGTDTLAVPNLSVTTSLAMSGDIDLNGNNIDDGGVIFLREQADADADVAGQGQIWVDTATPNVLFFTDDAGTDFRVSFSTSAQLAAMVSDETGTGALVFATSPTLVTPALGTPASGVLTNCTGLPEGGLLDNAVTLAKMAGGTDGNLITYDASGDPAFVTTGTSGQVLTSNGAGAAPTFQTAPTVTWTSTTPIHFTTPESNASPTHHTLATATAHKSGMLLEDDLDSTFNAYCICPEDLASTPAAQIVLYFMPTGAATTGNARITVSRLFVNNNESADQAYTAETEASVSISATAETITKQTFTLAASPTAGELVQIKIERQASSDASDTYEADIVCTGGVMLIDLQAS